ncbi:MAG: tRNA 2-thiocytidine(32) synthetase TtcA [Sandaracinaceae bacterium]|nr:MAG: tRNA 2-thiocytidine(32) synthetase TtcA [Sandaracinaceae bacterium]HBQ15042.1 tRNA 2-thiocytidine(32) synthetase TtcA [Myxococcales bacterium]
MTETDRLEKQLARAMGRCIADHALIEEGDRVMVCLSGGKDSYTLLDLLERARRRAPISFELIAVHLDQAQPGYDGRPLARWLEARGTPHRILREDTYSIVTEKLDASSTYCSLCSRLRRGILYNVAEELGCTKIALGHHREDALETLLLNLMYTGSLKSMPPKLRSDDGRNVVIRPLMYCDEPTIARWAELAGYPILPCNLCGSQDGLKRAEVKRLLGELEGHAPRVKESMLAALSNVVASHLHDRSLRGQPVEAKERVEPPADDRRRLPLL